MEPRPRWSEDVRARVGGDWCEFDPVGVRTLEGLPGDWKLFAYVEPEEAAAR
jgi:hypothetical protein